MVRLFQTLGEWTTPLWSLQVSTARALGGCVPRIVGLVMNRWATVTSTTMGDRALGPEPPIRPRPVTRPRVRLILIVGTEVLGTAA
jgi:hypothetical protein